MSSPEYRKDYYQKNKHKWKEQRNPEKHNENMRNYIERNKEAVNARRNKWVEDNYEWNLWSQSKRRARYSGLEWDLQREDIVIPELCPYLNVPLTRLQGKGFVWSNASLDRVDNSKGYTKDNIMVISRLANSMKQHATKEQLLEFAKNVIKLHEQTTT